MPAIAATSAASVLGEESLPTCRADSRWNVSAFSLPQEGVAFRSAMRGGVSLTPSRGACSRFTAIGVAAAAVLHRESRGVQEVQKNNTSVDLERMPAWRAKQARSR